MGQIFSSFFLIYSPNSLHRCPLSICSVTRDFQSSTLRPINITPKEDKPNSIAPISVNRVVHPSSTKHHHNGDTFKNVSRPKPQRVTSAVCGFPVGHPSFSHMLHRVNHICCICWFPCYGQKEKGKTTLHPFLFFFGSKVQATTITHIKHN